MTHQEFIAKVAIMRSRQREYLKHKTLDNLRQKKASEIEVDRAIQESTTTSKLNSL